MNPYLFAILKPEFQQKLIKSIESIIDDYLGKIEADKGILCSRKSNHVNIKICLAQLLYFEHDFTTSEIAKGFGLLDHTTILYYLKEFKIRYNNPSYKNFDNTYNELKSIDNV